MDVSPLKREKAALRERRRRQQARQAGMTLLEIMVVVVIVGLLGTVVGVALIRRLEEGKVGVARTQVCNLAKALGHYRLKKGTYPSNSGGLNSLVSEGIWGKKKIPKDPWNNEYFYRQKSATNPSLPDVFSYGSDGKEGGSSPTAKDIRCEKD